MRKPMFFRNYIHAAFRSPRLLTAVLAVVLTCLLSAGSSFAQSSACQLIPDDKNPPEQMLKCGDNLLIRSTKGAKYRRLDRGTETPAGIRLDSGAVMIEFTPSVSRRDFQILTPHAIAAVRGTKWVVDVNPKQTSTLVLSGGVSVSHRKGGQSVILDPGEGADVTSKLEKIEVKRWSQNRIQALLARFGQ